MKGDGVAHGLASVPERLIAVLREARPGVLREFCWPATFSASPRRSHATSARQFATCRAGSDGLRPSKRRRSRRSSPRRLLRRHGEAHHANLRRRWSLRRAPVARRSCRLPFKAICPTCVISHERRAPRRSRRQSHRGIVASPLRATTRQILRRIVGHRCWCRPSGAPSGDRRHLRRTRGCLGRHDKRTLVVPDDADAPLPASRISVKKFTPRPLGLLRRLPRELVDAGQSRDVAEDHRLRHLHFEKRDLRRAVRRSRCSSSEPHERRAVGIDAGAQRRASG